MVDTHFARKRFGQHFLKDEQIISRIVRELHPQPADNLVEIGGGLGALTQAVLAQIPHLHVVEIDRDLSAHLQATYPDTLTVHEFDALKFDFSELFLDKKLRVFGNLPYNISSPLLFHLLTFSDLIQDLLFMLQKEVVVRLAAPVGHAEYGRLSVMIQYACKVHHLFDVPPTAFSPPPKVMSSVVKLIPYQGNLPHPQAQDKNHFAQLVNIAFQHRRKTLKNALETLVPVSVFEGLGIDPQRRPQTLTVKEFVDLSNALS